MGGNEEGLKKQSHFPIHIYKFLRIKEVSTIQKRYPIFLHFLLPASTDNFSEKT